MKENQAANTEGTAEKDNKFTTISYILIALLAIFAYWSYTSDDVPSFAPEQAANVTLFSSDAEVRSGIFSFFKEKSPDLQINILSTGIFDANGVYYEGDTLKRGLTGGARLEVSNVGDKTSEPWDLFVHLPVFPNFEYENNDQPPLEPGESRVLRMTFNQLQASSSAKLLVNLVTDEENQSNNIDSKIIPIVD